MKKLSVRNYTMSLFGKEPDACSTQEIYESTMKLTLDAIQNQNKIKGDKKVYYISSEFLIGKLLSNNLINLHLYDDVKKELEENGHDILKVEEFENEPSIGNGGLGRLAACFIDSIATLNLPCDGITLNYHFGLFKQSFENGLQNEKPNPWLSSESWQRKTETSFEVEFGKFKVNSILHEIDVLGYNGGVNTLKMFDIDTVDESIITDGISFDKTDIKRNLTLFLYPDDSDKNGELLRIYQQYFMVSSGAQMIIKDLKDRNINLSNMANHVVIQINDTHPTLVIPELINLLVKEGFDFADSVEIVKNTVAYTNHTILAEALEKWPLEYLNEVVPHLVPIIQQLDQDIKKLYTDENLAIIDSNNRVHMAHICIHFGFSVNGVAALHTDILKSSELKHFYDIYPDKFNNKTNGITFRRWLLHANPELTELIEKLIGDEFKVDANQLEKLLEYKEDKEVLNQLSDIKRTKKLQLAKHLKETQNITMDPDSICDIQVKRLHEYKRQQMNALYIIDRYMKIKNGLVPDRPVTFIFGAKAAPAYTIAKDIIHLLLTLGKVIDKDPIVSKYLKIVFVENYNVTEAQYLFPAADISEQISLASKEASGTGNMKFMLNGAITLGTEDGANVEIKDLVKEDNIFIFGEKSDKVIDLYKNSTYNSKNICENDKHIAEIVDFIIDPILIENGNVENLKRLHNEIISKDWFMTLLDINDYIKVKNECISAYENQEQWQKMALVNIARSGFFSSDRTIKQYNNDIWHL